MKNTQQTKTIKNTAYKTLLSYSAIAATVFSAGRAHATIQYTDVTGNSDPDSTLNVSNDVFTLDLNGDNVDDFKITLKTFTHSWTYNGEDNFYANYNVRIQNLVLGNSFAAHRASSEASYYVEPLEFGSKIDNASITKWSYYDVNVTYPNFGYYSTQYSSSFLYGSWSGVSNKYVGVKFLINEVEHFGWIQLSIGDRYKTVTIHDYAYEDVAGLEIQAGHTIATNIQDIDSETTVYAFNNTVHINAKQMGSVKIINVAGQEVVDANIAEGSNQLIVNNAPGAYVVQIIQNGNTSNHKVHIH